MKVILTILLIITSLVGLTQSSGYVLIMADSSLKIPDNSITISKVSSLQAFLDAKLATNGNGSSLTGLTKTQVGLSNVDNTSDANKPVSSAVQTALNLKQNSLGFTAVPNTLTVNGKALSGNISITASDVGLGNVPNESKATMFTSPTFTGSPVVPGYQPLATNLTSIGALANGNGFLKNNGSGTFTYENPAGSGTVTSVSVVTANGISGSVATATSTPAITLTLGAITPTTVNGVTITDLLPKTTTSGVAASPTASGTVTVTHNLGRVPNTIRIKSISSFTSNAAATPVPFSEGTWNSTGNRCLYMVINGTTTQVSQTSTVFSIIMVTSAGNSISGVIGNVTSTSFDIVFTETGTHTAGNYLWEAQ